MLFPIKDEERYVGPSPRSTLKKKSSLQLSGQVVVFQVLVALLTLALQFSPGVS